MAQLPAAITAVASMCQQLILLGVSIDPHLKPWRLVSLRVDTKLGCFFHKDSYWSGGRQDRTTSGRNGENEAIHYKRFHVGCDAEVSLVGRFQASHVVELEMEKKEKRMGEFPHILRRGVVLSFTYSQIYILYVRSIISTMSDSDVLIVGAGIFGVSTAYHLSLIHHDPSRITILDRAPVPSPQAASTDINKIVRPDYGSLFYMQLGYEALDKWIEQPWLREHFHQTGWVALDEKDSDLHQRIRDNFKSSGRPDTTTAISLDQVRTSWGGVLSNINMDEFDKAYTNSSPAWADASSAVHAMMQKSSENGVQYVVGEVKSLETANNFVSVRTSDGQTHTAKRILLATGAWTPWLMTGLEASMNIPAEHSINKQITAAGVCVTSFKLTEAEADHYSQMPILIYGAHGEVMPPTKEKLFKFTNSNTFINSVQHPSGTIVSLPAPDQHSIPTGLRKQSIDIIRSRIPEILDTYPEPHEWRLCWDAVSPDQNQLICRHPDSRLSNLYLATAGSFHSWKFLPTIGKYVVNVLNGVSNGEAKDAAWKWKTEFSARGAHEKVYSEKMPELRNAGSV